MVRLLKQFLSSEKGQALPIVLALLAIGGLTIAPSLSYATTSLNGSRILEEDMKGVYAAGAGVEHALWSLGKGISPSQQLPENINQMAVTIQTEERGTYTLYLGELIQPGVHFDFLDVDGDMMWDGEAEAYKYIITVSLQQESTMHLKEVGARIPAGYSYQSGSAASFTENLSTDEPEEILDTRGVYMLNWELGIPQPSVSQENPVQTQTFYITITGTTSEEEGDYAWVVANRTDVGAVGEIAGTSYKITATATRPEHGRTTAKIVADVMIGETTYITSWQILN